MISGASAKLDGRYGGHNFGSSTVIPLRKSRQQKQKRHIAIMISEKVAASVSNYLPLSDRKIMVLIETTYRRMNVIQVYAATNERSDEEVKEFCGNLEEAMAATKANSGEINIAMDDFNAKICKREESETVGRYGLVERKERSDRLVQFCAENQFIVANSFYTFFKQHSRRLYTWKSPEEGI